MFKIGTPLKIEWVDIVTIGEWKDPSEINKELAENDKVRYVSYGHLVRETKEKIAIAQTMSFIGDKIEQTADTTDIPKKVIIKITKVL